ncbi:MAG: hypothetical protein JNL06_06695 [Alphaproteobacteria bacterium]|nr:hypothetical protein [Alphaproteobacteria bacterium]
MGARASRSYAINRSAASNPAAMVPITRAVHSANRRIMAWGSGPFVILPGKGCATAASTAPTSIWP